MALLEVKDLTIKFGGLTAVNEVSFEVEAGGITGLIGPNGAGKTTVFNLLTNVYKPTSGEILLDGKNVSGQKPHEAVQKGLARTFQNIRLFRNMSVLDNIKVSFLRSGSYSVLGGILRSPKYWREEEAFQEKALELLRVFDMEKYGEMLAGNLPYGRQRKLEICRALATEPRILLLDEPAAGMNPTETRELMQTIREIREHFKVAVLLIEHDMNLVMGICEHIVVLNYGKVIAKGTPREVALNPQVIEAYLGSEGAKNAAASQ